MPINKDKIIEIIYAAIDEVNQQLPKEKRLGESIDSVIYGSNRGLDSLGFVNFIVSLEKGFERNAGITISLTEDERLFDNMSSFGSVESLSDMLFLFLENKYVE